MYEEEKRGELIGPTDLRVHGAAQRKVSVAEDSFLNDIRGALRNTHTKTRQTMDPPPAKKKAPGEALPAVVREGGELLQLHAHLGCVFGFQPGGRRVQGRPRLLASRRRRW